MVYYPQLQAIQWHAHTCCNIAFVMYTLVLWLLGSLGILAFLGFKHYPDIMHHLLALLL